MHPCSFHHLFTFSGYSRLFSVMCSRLTVCPGSPPSASSSPPVGLWNTSLDRSPELEGFSSFWMSLLGSLSTETESKIEHLKVETMIIGFTVEANVFNGELFKGDDN